RVCVGRLDAHICQIAQSSKNWGFFTLAQLCPGKQGKRKNSPSKPLERQPHHQVIFCCLERLHSDPISIPEIGSEDLVRDNKKSPLMV
ncbi:TPA: hypothetical protein DCW56_04315, partial [Candidatus Peregrinibacteria bacterium]|nr:hypothetical protein [Candidatus Peregrinibacteria bacterium]